MRARENSALQLQKAAQDELAVAQQALSDEKRRCMVSNHPRRDSRDNCMQEIHTQIRNCPLEARYVTRLLSGRSLVLLAGTRTHTRTAPAGVGAGAEGA